MASKIESVTIIAIRRMILHGTLERSDGPAEHTSMTLPPALTKGQRLNVPVEGGYVHARRAAPRGLASGPSRPKRLGPGTAQTTVRRMKKGPVAAGPKWGTMTGALCHTPRRLSKIER
jgi:hypothetical protein